MNSGSKAIFIQGTIYADIFHGGRLLLDGELLLKLRFRGRKNNFELLSGAENPIFKVLFLFSQRPIKSI